MLAVGMPSSAARPGTDHSPGPRPVSTAGRPFCWPRMPRWLIRVRTCWSLNRLVPFGGRDPPALRTSATWPLWRPAAARSCTPARTAGESAATPPGRRRGGGGGPRAGGLGGAGGPLAPALVEHGPLGLGLGGGGHGDLQRGRRHRVQDLAGDPVIERSAGDVLAPAASPVVDLVESARVAVRGPCGTRPVVILDRHAVAPPATPPQPPPPQPPPPPARPART